MTLHTPSIQHVLSLPLSGDDALQAAAPLNRHALPLNPSHIAIQHMSLGVDLGSISAREDGLWLALFTLPVVIA
jgi:hypothetical protein